MRNKIICLFVLSIILLIIFGYIYFFEKSEFTGLVTGLDWKREWMVESYQMVSGNCWESGCTPNRAYNIQVRRETHHYNRIYTGQTCTKIGNTKSCTNNYNNVPVMRDRYYYTINDWRDGRITKSSGNDRNPFWPELNLNFCNTELIQPGIGENDSLLGCEREGRQTEQYYVRIKASDENIYPAYCLIKYSLWTDTRIEQVVSGFYWKHQNTIDCDSLKYT